MLPGPSHLHVLADRQLVARVVLEQHADAAAQRFGIELAQIGAADPHGALRRIVETQQQLDQRALAGAVLADQRDQLAAANVQAQVLDRRLGAAGILNVTSSNSMPASSERGTSRAGVGTGISRSIERNEK